MFFKTIHNNSILAFALMPFLLIAFWVGSMVSVHIPEALGDIAPMPLWGMVLTVMKGNKIVASVIVLLLAFLGMVGVNRFVNRYNLLNRPTAMPGIIYLLLVSGYVEVQHIQPVWFFIPLFLLAIEKLFSAHGQHRPMALCFDAAFWFSTGTLFFGKGIFFFPFLLIAMFILRVFTSRAILASILGLLLPYLFAYGYYMFIDKAGFYFETLAENFIEPVAFFGHSLMSKGYVAILILLVIFALVSVSRRMPTLKILTRKHYRIFNWLAILSLMAAMTPFYSLEIIPIVSLGSAILLAHFLHAIRPAFWKELFFALLVGITILAQIFV